MNTKTPNRAGTDTADVTLAPADIFELLANDRRRYLLQYLSRRVGGVALGEVAEQIAIWEDDPTYERYERILTALHHTQLPKLTEAGLVSYETETETVTGQDSIDQLAPYLELAMREDVR